MAIYKYPPEVHEFVKAHCKAMRDQELAEACNKALGTEFNKAKMTAFRKNHGYKTGRSGLYRKGHIPANKGKTLDEFIGDPERVAEIKSRMSDTMFRKGERPVNELPVGAVVINAEGYKLRKKQMEGTQWDRWEFLHRAVWEEHNGPIPDDMVVSFRDSNRLNCDIDNLMLITKRENSALTGSGYRFEDPALTDAGLAVIRLKQAAKDARKKRRG